jgi:hypothetical protein
MEDKLQQSMRLSKTIVPLFREYRQKLNDVRLEAKSLYRDAHDTTRDDMSRNTVRQQFIAVTSSFQGLRPAISHFARRVSQRLEHTDVDDIVRIEIELRLADLESDLELTSNILGSMFV